MNLVHFSSLLVSHFS